MSTLRAVCALLAILSCVSYGELVTTWLHPNWNAYYMTQVTNTTYSVYIDAAGNLTTFNTLTGVVSWSVIIQAPASNFDLTVLDASVEGLIVITHPNHYVEGRSAVDGHPLWKVMVLENEIMIAAVAADVVMLEDLSYSGGPNIMRAVSATSGSLLWRTSCSGTGDYYGGQAAIVGDAGPVVTKCGTQMTGYSRHSGAIVWSVNTTMKVYELIWRHGVVFAILTVDQNVPYTIPAAFDGMNGTKLWSLASVNCFNYGSLGSSPDGNVIVVKCDDGSETTHIYAFDLEYKRLKWKVDIDYREFIVLVVTPHMVVANTMGEPTIFAWSLQNGATIFLENVTRASYNLLSVYDDVMVTGSGQYTFPFSFGVGGLQYHAKSCSEFSTEGDCTTHSKDMKCDWCSNDGGKCYDTQSAYCCPGGKCNCTALSQFTWPRSGCVATIPATNCLPCGDACYDPATTPDCCVGLPGDHCPAMGDSCCIETMSCCSSGLMCTDAEGALNWQCCNSECCGLQQCGGTCCIICNPDGGGCD